MTEPIPTRMIAIDPAEPGGPEVLLPVERPVPRPGAGEVLIAVAAAGVNRPDVMQRKGAYPPPPGASSILGLEVAGTVVAAGEGAEGLVGKPMCALVMGGGYAQYCVASAPLCLPVPPALSMVEAAALPETMLTVWSNVFMRAGARPGETLLVHGGTGGIGTMAIMLGRLFGLTTIVTAGSEEKCGAARELGAAHAIDYRTQDFVAEVKAATDGRGVDIVLDMIGGDYLARNIACMAEEGRHVSIAVQRGAKGELPIWQVMARRLVLTGSTLRPRPLAYKAEVADQIREKVWPLVTDGRLKPVIDRTFPLAEAAASHRHMDEDHVGKVVLVVEEQDLHLR